MIGDIVKNKFKLGQYVIVDSSIYQFGGMRGVITDCPGKLKGYLVDLGCYTTLLFDDDLTLDILEVRDEKLKIILE